MWVRWQGASRQRMMLVAVVVVVVLTVPLTRAVGVGDGDDDGGGGIVECRKWVVVVVGIRVLIMATVLVGRSSQPSRNVFEISDM